MKSHICIISWNTWGNLVIAGLKGLCFLKFQWMVAKCSPDMFYWFTISPAAYKVPVSPIPSQMLVTRQHWKIYQPDRWKVASLGGRCDGYFVVVILEKCMHMVTDSEYESDVYLGYFHGCNSYHTTHFFAVAQMYLKNKFLLVIWPFCINIFCCEKWQLYRLLFFNVVRRLLSFHFYPSTTL